MENQPEGTLPEAGAAPSPADSATDTKGGVVETLAEGGEAKKEGEGKEGEPQPKTYSEEEFRGLQAAKDREVAAVKAESERVRQEAAELAQKIRAQERLAFVEEVKGQGGNADAAARMFDLEATTKERERKLAAREVQIDERLKQIQARDLAEKYELDAAAKARILEAKDPLEAENVALKLRLEKVGAKTKQPVKTDSGVGSPKGVDLSKMSPEEQLRWYYEHQDKK